jgi:hypothetical protein
MGKCEPSRVGAGYHRAKMSLLVKTGPGSPVLAGLPISSVSRLTAAVVRKGDPMPPRPPAFDTAAASSADVQVPMGVRMIGTSIPNKLQSGVFSMLPFPINLNEQMPIGIGLGSLRFSAKSIMLDLNKLLPLAPLQGSKTLPAHHT